MTGVLVALAGGLGAVVRFLLDTWIGRRSQDSPVPLGTMVINVTGSFLLGLLIGWWMFRTGDPGWRLVLGTGFLGGYTTFSTASVLSALGLAPATMKVLEPAALVLALEDDARAFVLAPTIVGELGPEARSIAHRLLRTAMRKRIPFTNSCHAASGLAAAVRAEGDESTWSLRPLSRTGASSNQGVAQ